MSMMAEKMGLSTGDLGAQLSQMLPQVVDQLTPDGQVPEGGLGNLGDLLRAGRVEAEKRRNADELLALMMQVANGMATSTLFGTIVDAFLSPVPLHAWYHTCLIHSLLHARVLRGKKKGKRKRKTKEKKTKKKKL